MHHTLRDIFCSIKGYLVILFSFAFHCQRFFFDPSHRLWIFVSTFTCMFASHVREMLCSIKGYLLILFSFTFYCRRFFFNPSHELRFCFVRNISFPFLNGLCKYFIKYWEQLKYANQKLFSLKSSYPTRAVQAKTFAKKMWQIWGVRSLGGQKNDCCADRPLWAFLKHQWFILFPGTGEKWWWILHLIFQNLTLSAWDLLRPLCSQGSL